MQRFKTLPHPIIRKSGYTLIEVLVVVTLAAVLLSLAAPALTGMVITQQSISLVNAFLASLNLARSESIKRNARAVVCKSATGLSCASNGGWEQGWIVFHDANNNAALDAGELVLQQQGAASIGLRLTGNTQVASYVSYSASGSAKLVSGAFQAGTFTLCPSSATATDVRQVVLSGTGRPRTQKGTAADCP